MTGSEAIRRIMKEKHITQTEMARILGTNQSTVGTYLRSANMRSDTMVMLADKCGYDLVLVDRLNGSHMYKIGEDDELYSQVVIRDKSVYGQADDDKLEETIRRVVHEEMRKAAEDTPPRSE